MKRFENFIHFMQTAHSPMNTGELLALINDSQNQCIFIKNEQSHYKYANHNYIQLMGLHTLNQLLSTNDSELSKNKQDAKKYRELDERTLEEGKALSVCEVITPYHNQPIEKTMQGKLYPLYTKENRANFVLGIVAPQSRLLKLDFETLFRLTSSELENLLLKRSYTIRFKCSLLQISKMEIRLLAQLMKGSHAGEIAKILGIKQTTVESYLVNIKNKLGVNSKSALIKQLIDENILQQVMI